MSILNLDLLWFLPILSALVYGLRGFGAPWGRVIRNTIFIVAAIIIALQHNFFLTEAGANLVGMRRADLEQYRDALSAGVFSLSVFGIYVAINIVFRLLWGPLREKRYRNDGLAGYARLAINGVAGWVFGAAIVAGMLSAAFNYAEVTSSASRITLTMSEDWQRQYIQIVLDTAVQTVSALDVFVPEAQEPYALSPLYLTEVRVRIVR